MPIEVIVVDDASTDGTAQWLARAYPDVRVVRLERNGGFCAAANAGIAAAEADFVQLLNNDTEVTAGWIEAGLAPFADPTVGSVAPLVLVRSEPGRVDSAGDSYALVGWPTKRGHGQPRQLFAGSACRRGLRRQRISAFYRAAALQRPAALIRFSDRIMRTSTWRFACAGPAIAVVFAPRCVIYHDVSATYDHGSPALQRRMSRNAELVFWANYAAELLVLALVPHLAFLAVQGAWRLARGRLRPFLAGKWDAVRAWPEIKASAGFAPSSIVKQ